MSMKVLICDPDWRFAENATAYYESRAHLVINQTRSEEAFAIAKDWRPDLVILAAEMAEDGLLERISCLPNESAILITEYMDRYDRAWRVWQRGGHELLMKPIFKTSELREATVSAMRNAAAGTGIRQVAATA